MCAIGRALMARPRVLMLDEPTLGLAPVLVAKIFETVRVINGEGVTVLLVEQRLRSGEWTAGPSRPGTRPAERRTSQACVSGALRLGPGGKL